MYPDTDSAPIPVLEEEIEAARLDMPLDLSHRLTQLRQWDVPADADTYLLRNNLMPILEQFATQNTIPVKRLALLYAHLLKSLQGTDPLPFDHQRISDLIHFILKRQLEPDLLAPMLKVLYKHPNMQFSSVLEVLGYKDFGSLGGKNACRMEINEQIPLLVAMWTKVRTSGSKRDNALRTWIMGRLQPVALGNIPLSELSQMVDNVVEGKDA